MRAEGEALEEKMSSMDWRRDLFRLYSVISRRSDFIFLGVGWVDWVRRQSGVRRLP